MRRARAAQPEGRTRVSENKNDFPDIKGGLPHSEIHGSKLIRSSPQLIAAYHVLHRLCMPRHPPNALLTLDRSHCQCVSVSNGFDISSMPNRPCDKPGGSPQDACPSHLSRRGQTHSKPYWLFSFSIHLASGTRRAFPEMHQTSFSRSVRRRAVRQRQPSCNAPNIQTWSAKPSGFA